MATVESMVDGSEVETLQYQTFAHSIHTPCVDKLK